MLVLLVLAWAYQQPHSWKGRGLYICILIYSTFLDYFKYIAALTLALNSPNCRQSAAREFNKVCVEIALPSPWCCCCCCRLLPSSFVFVCLVGSIKIFSLLVAKSPQTINNEQQQEIVRSEGGQHCAPMRTTDDDFAHCAYAACADRSSVCLSVCLLSSSSASGAINYILRTLFPLYTVQNFVESDDVALLL